MIIAAGPRPVVVALLLPAGSPTQRLWDYRDEAPGDLCSQTRITLT